MKMQRVRVPVSMDDAVVDEVTGVLKIPRRFVAGQTAAVVLAHGAGGGVDDPCLAFVQSFLVGRGYLTLGFNFPYREKGRKAPDREALLEATVSSAIAWLRGHSTCSPGLIFAGGKSMGGRMASHLVSRDPALAAALILLAYPLHAPGRPDRVRDKHLASIAVPTLFVSGTRDALAPADALRAAVKKVARASLVPIEGADHSFKMLKSSRVAAEDVWERIAEPVANWIDTVVSARAARPNADLVSPQAATSVTTERNGVADRV
jgi:predicted alpha/beta-hydrolase family hydrolase